MQAAISACDLSATVAFNIPGAGPFVISPAFALPLVQLNCPPGPGLIKITIDGTTQPGASTNTASVGFNANNLIVLDGGSYSSFGCVLDTGFGYGEGALAIRGLQVRNFTYGGFTTALCGRLEVTGSEIYSNTYAISANSGSVIGGSAAGDRNVIRGNTYTGIETWDPVSIVNNYIGVNNAGTGAAPNGGDGISLNCTSGVSIVGNVISGNAGRGLFLGGADASTFQNNKIGVAADGTTPLGNGGTGIYMGFGECSGGDTNVIQGNTIANNGQHGVSIITGVGNRITGNSIYANGAKNIDLDFYGGPLGNDPLDVDGDPPDSPRPNNWQNKPNISLVTQSGGNTSVTWNLGSAAGKAYQVEIFSNPAAVTPAGKTLIATVPIMTDASGNYSETTVISGSWDNVSGSAIDQATDDTSEFSGAVAVTPTPEVTVTPNPKNFGNVIVGASLGPLGITVTSVGSAPYVINAFDSSPTCYGGPICSSGAFICANSCTTSTPYATSASCSIDVTFAPSVVGLASTTFYICDNAAGSPRAVTLLGQGVAPPPVALSISPTGHDFGAVLVGSSAVHTFTISNPGTGDATMSGPPTVTGPFQIASTTCGAILAASASCLANVRFVPVTNGNATGTLNASASGATASATLVGTGLRQSMLEMTSSLIDLGSTALGGAPLTLPVSLRNIGNAALTIDRISVGAPFTLTNGCPLNLLPGETCVVTLGLNPTEIGIFNGSLVVVTNAPGGSRSVPVRGQVQARPEPVVRVSPASIGFGDRMGGTQTASQRVTVVNDGGVDAVALTLSITTPHFLIVNTTCGNVLAPQSTCFADVAFLPTGFGPKRATLNVTSTAPTVGVSLSGAGCRPPQASPGRSTRLNCGP